MLIDEDNAFMKSYEFAHAARRSSNYYVLVAREALPQLPYSVDEIYSLRNTGRASSKYPAYSRVYTSTYRIYADDEFAGEKRSRLWWKTATRGLISFRRFAG